MGAPKGNRNAYKHGLFGKDFSPEELAGLRKMPPNEYRHELAMMRVVVKNTFEIHKHLHAKMQRDPDDIQACDAEAFSKVTNSLSVALTALNTTARTQAVLTGTDESLKDAFEQALVSLPIFIDDKYLSGLNPEAEDEDEILVENFRTRQESAYLHTAQVQVVGTPKNLRGRRTLSSQRQDI
jgi:hypothetical protein